MVYCWGPKGVSINRLCGCCPWRGCGEAKHCHIYRCSVPLLCPGCAVRGYFSHECPGRMPRLVIQKMEPGLETSDLGQVPPFLADNSVWCPADSLCSLQCPCLTWLQLKPSDFGNFLCVSGGLCIYPQLLHVRYLGLDVLPPCCAPGEGLCSLCLWLRDPRGE